MSDLLKGRAKVADAERTMGLSVSAYKKGNLRLAVSRAITAIIIAARSRSPKRAQKVIASARKLIHGVAISKMSGTIKGLMGPSKKDLSIDCEHVEVMTFTLARGGIPFDHIKVPSDRRSVIVSRKYAGAAKRVLLNVTGGKTRTILKVS